MRGRKSMDMSNCLFTSVFSLEIQLSKGNATTPLNSQTPPLVVHVQARYCLQRLMSYPLFVLNHLRWEVAVLFINVNRIIDHHCLNIINVSKFLNIHNATIRYCSIQLCNTSIFFSICSKRCTQSWAIRTVICFSQLFVLY
jgi:hypothetical protein